MAVVCFFFQNKFTILIFRINFINLMELFEVKRI